MEQLHYKQRICTDKEKIENFLARSRVGIIGLNAGEYPYAVPVNYVWWDGKAYFHGMGSGKRESVLQKEP
jgi:nitroimidazol reductase NimA-like FMN-containing flavoprotein (pyridoxamine 5'-phosphate oxidase superfamily)